MTFGQWDLGDILRHTFTIYGRNLWRFAAIVAVVMVPLGILWLVAAIAGMVPFILGNGEPEALLPLLVILSAVSFIASLLMTAALIHGISQQYFVSPISITQAYRFAWRRLGSLVGAGLLAGVAVAGLAITVIGIPAAIYFGITWAFLWQTVLLEGCAPRAALAHSSALVRQYWWRVLGILLLFSVIAGVINSLLSMVPVFGAIIGSILTPPITIIGATLLYYDLRVRKQGYTLEALAAELRLAGALS